MLLASALAQQPAASCVACLFNLNTAVGSVASSNPGVSEAPGTSWYGPWDFSGTCTRYEIALSMSSREPPLWLPSSSASAVALISVPSGDRPSWNPSEERASQAESHVPLPGVCQGPQGPEGPGFTYIGSGMLGSSHSAHGLCVAVLSGV